MWPFKKKVKTLAVLAWKKIPLTPVMEKECDCGQMGYISPQFLEQLTEQFGIEPDFTCIICALRKHAHRFNAQQLTDLKVYYKSIIR